MERRSTRTNFIAAVAACVISGASVWGAGPARAVSPRPLPVRTIPIADARDLAYSASTGVIYASVGGGGGVYATSVVPVNAVTLQVGMPIPVGSDPGELSITDDGSYLYVTVNGGYDVQRVNLATAAVDLQFTVGTVPAAPQPVRLRAGDIEALPGSRDSLAVAMRNPGFNQPSVAVFDNGVRRAALAIGGTRIVFPPGDPTRIYSYNNQGPPDAYVLNVDLDGVTTELVRRGVLTGFPNDIAYDSGTLWDGTNLAEAATLTRLGTAEGAESLQDTVPFADVASNKLYTLNPCQTLRVYAADTLAEVAGFLVPCNGAFSNRDTPLIAAGGHQYAYLTLTSIELFTVETINGAAGEFTAVTPERVLDTRTGNGTGGVVAAVGPGGQLDVQITGRAGVPATGVAAVVLNATIAGATATSYLTVWPTGLSRPDISNLNYAAGTTRANLVTVAVGSGGKLSLFNEQGSTDVLFDVIGYYSTFDGALGSRFRPLEPSRAFDTRTGAGGVQATPLEAGSTLRFDFTGTAGVPHSGVSAIAVNVTAVDASADSYLTVWPDDVARPNASNLNFTAGSTVPNLVIMRVPKSGIVDFYNFAGSTHVLADVVGYYTTDRSGEGGRFVAYAPFRLVDSRIGVGSKTLIGPNWTIDLTDNHEMFDAYALNVTAVDARGQGYVTAHPIAATPPNASNLNYADGQTVPNAVIVRTEFGFQLSNFGGSVYLLADVFGAFTSG